MQTPTRLPQRIAVVGTSGSGKTTLARRLSQLLGIPHVEFDALYWGPNWTPPDKAVFRENVSQLLTSQRWVSCGNYHNTLKDIALPRADTLVWLDYPFALILARLVRRTTKRLMVHEQVCGNNHERLRKTLSRESIILWAFQSHWKNRRRYLALGSDPDHGFLSVVRLRSPRETEQFVQSLSVLVE